MNSIWRAPREAYLQPPEQQEFFMNRLIICAALLLALVLSESAICGTSREKGDFVPVYNPELTVYRARGKIEIDGEIGDPGWKGAARVGNFAEHNPGDQTRPDVETEVLITYDDKYLYTAWICYDDPDEVRATFCERDQIFKDDNVVLLIDTFGDASMGYEIMTNPYGIPGDLLISSAAGEDTSYDMVFETAGRITDFGWVAEIAVPFENLRFPEREEQVWKMDFWRNRPRESRFQYSWAAYDRDQDCWVCQWGTVRGISGVEPGAGFKLLPAVVAHQSGSMNERGHMENGDIIGDAALGISYDISSELKTEATINPDFSQVEADVSQIDVNTTFALSYPEKRPFFQEGSDLFNTDFKVVYTRSINDPSLAGKVTWREDGNSIAFLTARDEHSAVILPFEERSRFVQNGESYSNILRYRRDLGDQSHIGLIATDRRFDQGGYGTLVGVDGRIRFTPSNSAEFQLISTHTREIDSPELADSAFNATLFDGGRYTAGLDGEYFRGHAFTAGLTRSARDYWISADYKELSPTFRADNGLEPSNNQRVAAMSAGGVIRFEESALLETIELSAHGGRKWNFADIRKDEWISPDMVISFRSAQSKVHCSYMYSNELFNDIMFDDIWQFHTCFRTEPGSALRFGAHFNYGHRIARHDLVMGKERSCGAWADIKPVDCFMINTEFNYLTSDNLDSGENLFSQSVFWSRFSLQLSRELSLRLVAQYNDRFEKWDLDPLLKYRINSFTLFYIGSTIDYRDASPSDYGRRGWTMTERQYFMKLQYLFQV
ncbi:MAG: hypothetical protein GF417_00425 [Candidatus Latescibacteria bacterium]|nr:hypothetical protein [bacterium]MBD3422892.1 hypothetical protein [Candidatus Latescibacterota bacterium]